LDAYFANISALMTANTKAVITFDESERALRTGASIWSHSPDEIAACVKRHDPGMACVTRPLNDGAGGAALPRRSVLVLQRNPRD
jgi:hypothetical protein